jgi:hypothetical protein
MEYKVITRGEDEKSLLREETMRVLCFVFGCCVLILFLLMEFREEQSNLSIASSRNLLVSYFVSLNSFSIKNKGDLQTAWPFPIAPLFASKLF